MFSPDDTFLPPKSSFSQPVMPPAGEPDAGTLVNVCFSKEWLPYILGALQQLTLPTTWIGSSSEKINLQERAAFLIGMFANASEGCMPACDVITNIRQAGSGCTLEYSTDCGETWIQFADLSACEPEPAPDVRCILAFGTAKLWLTEYVAPAFGTMIEAQNTLDLLDPSTFDVVVNNYALTPNTFEQLRQIFIDIADDYDSGNPNFPTFTTWIEHFIQNINTYLQGLQCLLLNQIPANGAVTQDVITRWLLDLEVYGSGDSYVWFRINEIGQRTVTSEIVALSQAALAAGEIYDCSVCGGETFLVAYFPFSPQNWHAWNFNGNTILATHVTGEGWKATAQNLPASIYFNFGTTHPVTKVTVSWTCDPNVPPNTYEDRSTVRTYNPQFDGTGNGVPGLQQTVDGASTTDDFGTDELIFDGRDIAGVLVQVNNVAAGVYNRYPVITYVKIEW